MKKMKDASKEMPAKKMKKPAKKGEMSMVSAKRINDYSAKKKKKY